jgi:hypothetical protein
MPVTPSEIRFVGPLGTTATDTRPGFPPPVTEYANANTSRERAVEFYTLEGVTRNGCQVYESETIIMEHNGQRTACRLRGTLTNRVQSIQEVVLVAHDGTPETIDVSHTFQNWNVDREVSTGFFKDVYTHVYFNPGGYRDNNLNSLQHAVSEAWASPSRRRVHEIPHAKAGPQENGMEQPNYAQILERSANIVADAGAHPSGLLGIAMVQNRSGRGGGSHLG